MANASNSVSSRKRLRHIARRWIALAAQGARTEQKTVAMLYPSRGAESTGVSGNRRDVEFVAWQFLDKEWLTRCFRRFYLLQWTPLSGMVGGLASIILVMWALIALGMKMDWVSLLGVGLFVCLMLGTFCLFRVSNWAERLTRNEKELRALFRLTWTTRDVMAENPNSASEILFQPYMKDSLGRWFIRETLARIARIPVLQQ